MGNLLECKRGPISWPTEQILIKYTSSRWELLVQLLQQNIPKRLASQLNTIFFDCTYYIWKTLIDGSPSSVSVNHAPRMSINNVLEDLPKTSTLHAAVCVLSNFLHLQDTFFQTLLGNLVETAAQHSLVCSTVSRRASPRLGSNA